MKQTKTKEEQIYENEISPLLKGMIAGTGMGLAARHGFEYEYQGVPEGIETEIKRSIARIARAYHKSKSAPKEEKN